jgi:hypothetical protein
MTHCHCLTVRYGAPSEPCSNHPKPEGKTTPSQKARTPFFPSTRAHTQNVAGQPEKLGAENGDSAPHSALGHARSHLAIGLDFKSKAVWQRQAMHHTHRAAPQHHPRC